MAINAIFSRYLLRLKLAFLIHEILSLVGQDGLSKKSTYCAVLERYKLAAAIRSACTALLSDGFVLLKILPPETLLLGLILTMKQMLFGFDYLGDC